MLRLLALTLWFGWCEPLVALDLPAGLRMLHDPAASHLAEFADPSPPTLANDGRIEVYGSAPYCLSWPDRTAFERGDPGVPRPLDLRWPGGVAPSGAWVPWDLRRYRLCSAGTAKELLIGGAVSGSANDAAPAWPRDNIRRRLYLFHRQGAAWVRALRPLLGDPSSGWLGHSYGGNLFQPGGDDPGTIDLDAQRPAVLFYERVTDGGDGPRRTDIFMRGMRGESPLDDERLAVSVGDPPWPSTRRSPGIFASSGWLVEGPRPSRLVVDGQEFYVIGFSSGDYPTDRYGLDYAWSRRLEGPYHPRLDADHRDLLDLGTELKRRFALSWVGRPAFITTLAGAIEVLFHGVWKDRVPDNDYASYPRRHRLDEFARCLFKARVAARVEADGSLDLRLALDAPDQP